MSLLSVRARGPEALRSYLTAHVGVALKDFESGPLAIWFDRGDWPRRCVSGEPSLGLYGLCELMDNNPLVCADEASTPGPAATVALIGLGPLVRAGILLAVSSARVAAAHVDEIPSALATMGWSGELVAQTSEPPSHLVTAVFECTASGVISDWDELFEESYGRSFFVRRSRGEPSLIEGKPHAEYSLSVSAEGNLRVEVWADRDGKCGAAQLVHMFNVMHGFEEDLGLSIGTK